MIAEDTIRLLRETASVLVTDRPVARIEEGAILQGRSGATVGRYKISPEGERSFTLVTKEAGVVERRVLQRLQQQGQAVPRSHIRDVQSLLPLTIAMEDIRGEHRPEVLSYIDPEVQRNEAAALAAIHARNLRQEAELAWLPKVDWNFLTQSLEKWWRGPWHKVMQIPEFRRTFASYIPRVESAADKMLIEVASLNQDYRNLTLIHNDLCPANVLVTPEKQVFFLDWQEARYGSFYMDLPPHMPTFESTAPYRRALVREGVSVSLSEFRDKYRVACHYAGFANMWSALSAWKRNPSEEAYVRHWFNLILC
ncbi:phosphotransferase [Deinococcus cellulosilyticus]|uniref:Aminoglycoside phosphotransferase domain-containing protein n=1 Tax=Deinococcus cellulosilyticus (strain DSM 18568 / NBRC 106333 / KACC 11606 / 5516J-15) TaxID=1223518 RepID=A0A511N6M0_DEIC1|nr:phosphotransferase [Deinococcus cellulosilyticus]GEM48107.1 hypothetical protein DC3_37420 [Deinococcus cellulosilyticus NBRC 106333 = KACC 11606]